jgi:antirestriction protein ArdC
MHVEETKKMVDTAIEDLAAALEDGQSDTLKAYLKAMGRFHRYSIGNAMLIALQRESATRVAGFHTWKRLGRKVRKGERGIAILAPIVHRKNPTAQDKRTDESTNSEDAPASNEERTVAGFRTAHVFDVSQTDGDALPEFATVSGDPGELLSQLRQVVARRGIKLRYAGYLCGADGLSAGGIIVLRSGMTAAEQFSTMVHELAHEALHRDGTKRSKVVKETEAEAVAFVVCTAANLETNTASRDYIQLYDGDKKALLASLNRIRTVASKIIADVMPRSERRSLETERHSASDASADQTKMAA